jgi:hypothetical protein
MRNAAKPTQALATWLDGYIKTRSASLLLGSLGLLLLGAVVLFVTFWVVYLVIYLGFDWIFHMSHTVRLWVSAGFMLLLFIGNATTDREYLETYSFTPGTSSDKVVHIDIPGVVSGSTVNPLAPDSAHSYVKIITSVLYGGPRLVSNAWQLLRRVQRLRGLDRDACTAVLALLAASDGKVPFTEIASAIPRGHDVATVLERLRDIDGVLFLKAEPAGLSLLSDFREELGAL